MKLRLQGTPAECAKLCFLLRYGPPDLDVVEVSQPYPNRGDSRQVRVYLEVRFPEGLPPLEATFYSLTAHDGRLPLVHAWGTPVRQGGGR
jgi:hypothetical protein